MVYDARKPTRSVDAMPNTSPGRLIRGDDSRVSSSYICHE